MGNNRSDKLAKIAFAKAIQSEVVITGDYEDERQKFLALSQSLGIAFDTNNNVSSNSTNSNIATLQSSVSDLLNRVSNLEARLANYETHTHSYVDSTINDTDDGSGTTTNTNKTTGGVI